MSSINLLSYNNHTKTYSLRFPNLKELLLTNNLLEYGENQKKLQTAPYIEHQWQSL